MLHVSFKLYILFILCSFSSNVFAQFLEPDFDIYPSVEFQNKKKEILQKIIYSDPSGHYAIYASGKNGGGKKSIRKFNTNFKPMNYRIKINFTKNAFEPKTIDIITIDNKVYHIWSERSVNGVDYFSQEIDLLSESIKTNIKIATVSREEAYYEFCKPKLVLDSDLKRVYLFVELVKGQKENKKLSIFVFDSKMNSISHEKYTVPHDNKNFIVKSIIPTKNNAHILFGMWFSWEDKDKSIKAKEYSYFAYKLLNNEVALLTEIKTKGAYLSSFLTETKGSDLYISGLLAQETRDIPSGLYFLKYDLSKKEIANEKRIAMPENFYKYPEYLVDKTNRSDKTKDKKKRKEDSFYVPKKLFITNKNEVILLTEQNSLVQSSGGGFTYGLPDASGMPTILPFPIYRFQSESTHDLGDSHDKDFGLHLRNDIAIFKFDNTGEILWSNKIEKQQEWQGTSSYISLYVKYQNNKLFLFYNGNYLNIEGNGDFLGKKDSALLCTVVKDNGNYQRQVIHRYIGEYPNVTMPFLSHYSDKYGVLLYSRAPLNVKRQKFTRVTLN